MIIKEGSSLLLYGRLLFFFLFLAGCQHKKEISKKDISILWENGRATGFSVPLEVLDGPADSLKNNLLVRLAGHGEQPFIAGTYNTRDSRFIFQPLIPFTRGLSYEILLNRKISFEVEIPRDTVVPKLISIFPSSDTVPENLLKVYLIFSRPMVQGHALQYIKLTNEKGDSLPASFLDLQTELWNEAGNELTVWLDPGRIKKDLIPNKKMGPPLIAGRYYKLIISGSWQDINGNYLEHGYTKSLLAIAHDSVSPSPDQWKFVFPEKNTEQPLRIKFGEVLDYALVQHAFKIVDSGGIPVNGQGMVEDGQKGYLFIPAKPWSAGSYKILIEARLEDLAGNNLNRLFDRDLKSVSKPHQPKEFFEKDWNIK